MFGGLRYVGLDADLRVTGPLGNELSASEGRNWVDPVVGAIYAWPLAIAYRYLDMDYEDGKGSDYFKYDMATSGPDMGVIFTF